MVTQQKQIDLSAQHNVNAGSESAGRGRGDKRFLNILFASGDIKFLPELE